MPEAGSIVFPYHLAETDLLVVKGSDATSPRTRTEDDRGFEPPENEKGYQERERPVVWLSLFFLQTIGLTSMPHEKPWKDPKPEGVTKEATVTSEERLPESPGSTGVVDVQTEMSRHPTDRGPLLHLDNYKSGFSGGSTGHAGVIKLPTPVNPDSDESMFSSCFSQPPGD